MSDLNFREMLDGCTKVVVQYEQFKVPKFIMMFGKKKTRKEYFGRDEVVEITVRYYKLLGIEFVSMIQHSFIEDPNDDYDKYSLVKLSSGRSIEIKTNDITIIRDILEGEVCDMCKETSGHWDPTENFPKGYDDLSPEEQVDVLYETACGAEFIFDIKEKEKVLC